jgi:hypothetical protein
LIVYRISCTLSSLLLLWIESKSNHSCKAVFFNIFFTRRHIYLASRGETHEGRKMQSQGSGEQKNHPKWRSVLCFLKKKKKKKRSGFCILSFYAFAFWITILLFYATKFSWLDLVNGFIPCGSVTITIANVDMITAKWNITSECCVMTIVILYVKH